MAFQVDGKLHKVFDTEQKSANFRAREFVIEVADGKYPQMVKFQLTQDKCELIDNHNEGEDLTVHFDLRGREWNGRYFTNLNAWRIEAATSNAGESASQPAAAAPAATPAGDEFMDDVPF
jgi:hypothetical protein